MQGSKGCGAVVQTELICSPTQNHNTQNYNTRHSISIVVQVHLSTSKEGYENLIFTLILCFVLHVFLTLFFFPVLLTICTNYRYSLSTLNKLSVKLISTLFDLLAVAGAVKELGERAARAEEQRQREH